MNPPTKPIHVLGIGRGEERVLNTAREPGRADKEAHRTARDSTSIHPAGKKPIHPAMPFIPPA